MKHLRPILSLIWRSEQRALMLSGLLVFAVLMAGILLLGLSGWFIIATGIAGLAGVGAVFNVFGPSAAIRFFALGRTVARYGERILTHDATLRVLTGVRVQLLKAYFEQTFTQMQTMRGSETLNQITSDTDALDGVVIRLFMPILGAFASLICAFALLFWLVSLWQAVWITGGFLIVILILAFVIAPATGRPAEAVSNLRLAGRRKAIDHLRGRVLHAFRGTLMASRLGLREVDESMRASQAKIYQHEARAGALITFAVMLIMTGSMVIGYLEIEAGNLNAPRLAIAFFGILGLMEILMPFGRGVSEFGRIVSAAKHLNSRLEARFETQGDAQALGGEVAELELKNFIATQPLTGAKIMAPINFKARAGDMVILRGASGAGKTTTLASIAGLYPVHHGAIEIDGQAVGELPENALREHVGFLLQRQALISGTIAENLRIAKPDADDDALLRVLACVKLDDKFGTVQDLKMRLGEGGAGLSGGEQKRLALARMLLRENAILLLDEPTEGLDQMMADEVISNIWITYPKAIIVISTHQKLGKRTAEIPCQTVMIEPAKVV